MVEHCTMPGATSAVDAYSESVLDILVHATWPDGSALVDVDESVLRGRLLPQIRAAGEAMVAAVWSSKVSRARRGGER